MAAAAAQLNVRIDPTLKKSGDSVLARNKLTPSDAVRGLWGYLARHQTVPAFLNEPGATDEADSATFDSGMGLALSVAHAQCGFEGCDIDPWAAMTETEREDWLADQMLEEMEHACR